MVRNEDGLNPSARPPSLVYGPILAILITVGIYLGAQLLSGVFLSLIPLLLHWTAKQSDTWLNTSAWAQFLFIAVAETLTLFSLYKFLKYCGQSFKNFGLNKPKPQYIFQALGGFAVYFVAYLVVLTVVSHLIPALNVNQKQDLGFNAMAHGSDLWLIFTSLIILAPVTEEIVVRGFLYGSLRTKLPILWSAIIASALFGAAHLSEGGKGGLLWVAGLDTFILSMVLCYLRESTKSIWPGVGVHMIKNGLAFVLLFNIFHRI